MTTKHGKVKRYLDMVIVRMGGLQSCCIVHHGLVTTSRALVNTDPDPAKGRFIA